MLAFAAAAWLWGLPLVALLVAGLAFWGARRVGYRRWHWHIAGLRLAFGSALVLALAGPLWTGWSERQAVVFIVDGSASLGTEGITGQLQAVDRWRRALPTATASAVVLAGDQPRLLAGLTSDPLADLPAPPGPAPITDLAAALRLAGALLPADVRGRVVLASDGWETRGRAADAVAELAARDLRLDLAACTGAVAPDVRVASFASSAQRLHQGATLELSASLVGNLAGEAHVRLFENQIQVAEQVVTLSPDRSVELRFQRRPHRRAINSYRLQIEPPTADTVASNNRAWLSVDVRGQPVVLYVTEDADIAAPLRRAMAGEGVLVEVRPPAAMPAAIAELLAYDAIICADLPASALGPERMRALADLVEQLGAGLVMIGGPQSFGAGGYQQSTLAEVLPVHMRQTDSEERKPTGLMLVLDRSGSMSGDKLQQCKAAAQATARLLHPKDYLGVVAFDSEAQWIVAPGRVAPQAIAAIDGLSSGGGTDIFEGVQAGMHGLQQMHAGAKHMIVLTDGHSAGPDPVRLVEAMQGQGITVSTVAVGNGADLPLLRRMARRGQGQCYEQTAPQDLKTIFTQDAMRHLGRHVQEGEFAPVVAEPHAMLAGWPEQVPPLLGYVRTERKAAAQVPLVTADGDPLLAHWRYGLGKVTAFTSGAGSRWAPLWIAGWPGYAAFWSQVLRSTMRPPQGQLIDVRLTGDGDTARAVVDVLTPAQRFADEAEVSVEAFHLDTDRHDAELVSQGVHACRQIAPGRYEASWPLAAPGIWVVQARAGARLASASLVHQLRQEQATGSIDQPLLDDLAAAGGGIRFNLSEDLPVAAKGPPLPRRIPLAEALVIAALLLLVAEVALRRLAAGPAGQRVAVEG